MRRDAILSLGLVLLVPLAAGADGFDAERFTPAAGAAGAFTAEPPVVPFHLGWSVGLYLNLADDPVIVRDQASEEITARPVDTSLGADLLASLGLWRRFELALHLPLRLVLDGDSDVRTPSTTLSAGAGLGDLRLVPRVVLWGAGDASKHLALGLAVPVSLPTGDETQMRGAGGVTVEPRLMLLGAAGRLAFIGNLGYRVRTSKPAGLPVGNELLAIAAARIGLVEEQLDGHVELSLGAQLDHDAASDADLPAELLFGLAWHLGRSWRLFGGASLGLTDGLGSPDLRGALGLRTGSPLPRNDGFGDDDGDGIVDRSDDCPDEAEDADAFADHDGCPEPDNDRDGIADREDECPDLPAESAEDSDGCPSRTHVQIRDGEVVIYGKVLFRSGSDEIDQRSDPLLDQIAVALEGHQQIRLIRIEGHTDDVGPAEHNQRLSQQRAERVVDALARRGVSRRRLEAVGHGESRPQAPNRSPAGRAKNRRVEFVIAD
jgi:outer membrane protein OmpA-like peptidoglycan-associated protein